MQQGKDKQWKRRFTARSYGASGENDEFCINDDEFCIEIDEFCIRIDEFCIRIDEFCIWIDEFCIWNDEFFIERWSLTHVGMTGAELGRHGQNAWNSINYALKMVVF